MNHGILFTGCQDVDAVLGHWESLPTFLVGSFGDPPFSMARMVGDGWIQVTGTHGSPGSRVEEVCEDYRFFLWWSVVCGRSVLFGNIAQCDALTWATLSPSKMWVCLFLKPIKRSHLSSCAINSSQSYVFRCLVFFGTRHFTQKPSKNADTFEAAKRLVAKPNTGQLESVLTVL